MDLRRLAYKSRRKTCTNTDTKQGYELKLERNDRASSLRPRADRLLTNRAALSSVRIIMHREKDQASVSVFDIFRVIDYAIANIVMQVTRTGL